MPRLTHPATRHRHDRAHIRFHRDRWVKKRGRQYLAVRPRWWWIDVDRDNGPWGIHDDEQMWLGCHRANCGICGYMDDSRRRTRERVAWQVVEEAAW